MTLTCLGSGSSGNCYLLDNDGEVLILDCGISIKEIQSAMNWDFSSVVGVIVTHAHKDHKRCLSELDKFGVPSFTPYLYSGFQRKTYGGYAITAIPLRSKEGKWLHTNGDGSECPIYGFLIASGGRRIAYFTDYEYLPYTFVKTPVNAFLIACNHEDDADIDDEAKSMHVYSGHSSLSTVKEIIRVNKTPAIETVILCHTTWAADRDRMIREITEVAGEGVMVDVAEAGKTYK